MKNHEEYGITFAIQSLIIHAILSAFDRIS